jgi:hypothetical protein
MEGCLIRPKSSVQIVVQNTNHPFKVNLSWPRSGMMFVAWVFLGNACQCFIRAQCKHDLDEPQHFRFPLFWKRYGRYMPYSGSSGLNDELSIGSSISLPQSIKPSAIETIVSRAAIYQVVLLAYWPEFRPSQLSSGFFRLLQSSPTDQSSSLGDTIGSMRQPGTLFHKIYLHSVHRNP